MDHLLGVFSFVNLKYYYYYWKYFVTMMMARTHPWWKEKPLEIRLINFINRLRGNHIILHDEEENPEVNILFWLFLKKL